MAPRVALAVVFMVVLQGVCGCDTPLLKAGAVDDAPSLSQLATSEAIYLVSTLLQPRGRTGGPGLPLSPPSAAMCAPTVWEQQP
jgi:hypothetical protein